MDGVTEECATTFGGPFAAPRDGVVLGPPPPGGFDGRQVGVAGDTARDEQLQLLYAMAEAILKNRHDSAGRSGFGTRELIDLA